MKTIYFATTNKAKIKTLNEDLLGLNIKIEPIKIDLPEPRSDETEHIASEKVLFAYGIIKKPVIAQDGGFYIDSLNGFPKAFVNFAIETIGIEGILKLLHGKERYCEFRDTLAFFDGKMKKPKLFTSISRGRISDRPFGKMNEWNWGELHKVFIPEGWDKTFCQMTKAEIESWRGDKRQDWLGNKFVKWLRNR